MDGFCIQSKQYLFKFSINIGKQFRAQQMPEYRTKHQADPTAQDSSKDDLQTDCNYLILHKFGHNSPAFRPVFEIGS